MIDLRRVVVNEPSMYQSFVCTIPIKPYSKSNHLMRSPKGFMYIPKEYKEFDKIVKRYVREAMDEQEFTITARPCHLHIDNYYPTKGVVDVINCFKSLGDVLSGMLYYDDRQIVTCSASKHYDKENPRVEIILLQTDEKHDMVNVEGVIKRYHEKEVAT